MLAGGCAAPRIWTVDRDVVHFRTVDEYMTALGRVTAAAGDLELASFAVVRVLHGGDFRVVQALTADLTFDRLVDVAGRLAGVVLAADGDTRKTLEAWRAKARDAMRRRNQLLHLSWAGGADEGYLVIDRRKQRTIDVAELDAVTEALAMARESGIRLGVAISTELGTVTRSP
jgi:hypothetical protein